MIYEIHLSSSAYDFLKKIEKNQRIRLIKKLESLSKNPYAKNAKKIVGQKDTILRIRVGPYRILYEIIERDKVVLIVKIDKRSKVYR